MMGDVKLSGSEQENDIELRPDGQERFEKAIDIALKTPAIRKEKPSIVKRKP